MFVGVGGQQGSQEVQRTQVDAAVGVSAGDQEAQDVDEQMNMIDAELCSYEQGAISMTRFDEMGAAWGAAA